MTTNTCPEEIGAEEIRSLLTNRLPVLPAEELEPFVRSCFAKAERYLDCCRRRPSPLYVLETATLRQKARRFRAAFQAHLAETAFYYAVKSNNNPEISAVLLQEGFGLDVSSGLELTMALQLGARDIIFSGPGKTVAELELAVSQADRVVILVDSFNELAALGSVADRQQRPVRIGVRLTTNPQGLWRKFGIPLTELAAFLEKAAGHPLLTLQGLQFHTSWNLTPEAQIDFLRQVGAVLGQLPPARKANLAFLDIGGGYWPQPGEWLQSGGTVAGRLAKELGRTPDPAIRYRLPARPIEFFAEELGAAIREHIFAHQPCRICFEPGRWLCNDAMHLLLSVVDKKCEDLVITDAGTNAVGWERFETDYFPILNLSRPAVKERTCNILGALCTPHDVWGYHYWGESIQNNDILMIPNQGAYTFSLRQHFIKPLPEVFVLE